MPAQDFWTDKRVERLLYLRERLHTYQEMADSIGTTIGAVKGKLGRMKLPALRPGGVLGCWTPELEERLTELWNNTPASATEIGKELGFGRGAIIGKAKRLNLKCRKVYSGKATRPKLKARKMDSVPPRVTDLVETFSKKRTLLELKPNECHWPVEGEGINVRFCGHSRLPGSSYCRFHRELSISHVKLKSL